MEEPSQEQSDERMMADYCWSVKLGSIHSFIQLAPLRLCVHHSPIYTVIVVHSDIQGKIVQWLAGSFCLRDFKFTPSILSEVPLLTGKAVDS